MELKTVEIEGKTFAEIKDGMPVYIKDGKETAFDAPGTISTISRLNGEAKGHREAKEAAEQALKGFEGIEDPKAAIEAMKTIANLDAKTLIDAGEVEKVKSEITKVFEQQIAAKDQEIGDLNSTLHGEKIGGSFARSKFIADKVSIPADLIQAQFGKQFSLDGGKIVAKDAAGNQIYSRANPGELANFDEALETIINGYAYKDSILKGSGGSGTGKEHGNGGGANGPKTVTREQFDGLGQSERAAKIKDGFKVVDAA